MLMRIGDGWTPLLETGLASAEAIGDLDAQSRTCALLGWILHEEGRDAEALVHLEKAPGLAARAGDGISEAIAYVNYAAVLDATGEHERAGLLMLHAVSLADRIGHPSTQVLTLQHLAGHCLKAEEYEAALAHTLRAGELVAPDAVVIRASLQITLGEALAGIGRLEEAADQLERAIVAAERGRFHRGFGAGGGSPLAADSESLAVRKRTAAPNGKLDAAPGRTGRCREAQAPSVRPDRPRQRGRTTMRNHRKHTVLAAAAIAALSLGLTACGGGDGASGAKDAGSARLRADLGRHG
ncbi:hypothetical protein STANM309S_06200 [Streptomyces tanashiensis]